MDPSLNVPRWLKDELCLKRLSEDHLNNLSFHPRHGSLCRRLIAFLSESTLCGQTYPDIYAKEEHLEAEKELELAKEELQSVCTELGSYVKENENLERDLMFLKERAEHSRSLEDLVRTSTEALAQISGRPNILIEQVPRNLELADYLSEDLSTLYPTKPELTSVTARPTAQLDEHLNDIVRKVNIMYSAIARLYRTSMNRISQIDCHLEPIQVRISELLALKGTRVEEIMLDSRLDERELRNVNKNLTNQVHDLIFQVAALKDECKAKNNEVYRAHKIRLSKCLSILKELDSLSSIANVD